MTVVKAGREINVVVVTVANDIVYRIYMIKSIKLCWH